MKISKLTRRNKRKVRSFIIDKVGSDRFVLDLSRKGSSDLETGLFSFTFWVLNDRAFAPNHNGLLMALYFEWSSFKGFTEEGYIPAPDDMLLAYTNQAGFILIDSMGERNINHRAERLGVSSGPMVAAFSEWFVNGRGLIPKQSHKGIKLIKDVFETWYNKQFTKILER